ncbi:MAG TPA: Tim44-like domain-containing protein [Candidatus Dormibacteraeota bacterium]|nr:Tim44-like domain-containing protein [Candidatus Dormibacteraeota bacterium]
MRRTAVRRAIRWAVLALLVVGSLLGLPTTAFARGGGGGHSGGGGGGHSSGGGGIGGGGGGGGGIGGGGGGGIGTGGGGVGVGSGGVAYFGYDPIGILVLVVIAVVILGLLFLVVRRHPVVHDDFQPAPLRAGPDPAVMSAVDAIKAADPAFEPETFLQRAEMAFLLVNRAYQDRNVHAARAFMSPELWQSWRQAVEALIERGQRPVLENLNVRGMQVPFVAHAPDCDTVQVHLDYVAAVQVVDEKTGQLLSGDKEDRRLGQLWTFQRAAGAKTVVSGGVTASKCPNCGGLLKLNDDGTCNYCGADITSGRYDWVVTRIDQDWFRGVTTAAAFGAAEMDPATGLATIKAEDPTFDSDAFRGRAQQAFFALQQAWQDRDLHASRPFMSPGLYLGWSSQVRQLIELHKKNVLDGLRVDGIDVVKVIHGQAFDDVTVRVAATCADYEVDERNGRVIFGSKTQSEFVEYWTFQRSVGTQTTGRSILDKVCPNCGAPLEINQVGECRYCNAAVTSGRFDWVLSRIEQEDEYAG